MNKFLSAAAVGVTVFGLSGAVALAAQQSTQVRGTIESVNGNTVAIKTHSGKTVDLTLNPSTKFVWVEPSNLSNIKKGDFVGTAATGPTNDMVAQEVAIFPNAMRGTGEGHYPWSMPAAVAAADSRGSAASGAPNVQGTMTNGTVASTSTASGAPMVQGTMTNGTVANTGTASNAPMVQGTMTNGTVASGSSKSGGQELTISYNNGKKVQVLVPPTAPVVTFAPGQKSALTPGANAFIMASKPSGGSELSANFVAVGKNGLTPPM